MSSPRQRRGASENAHEMDDLQNGGKSNENKTNRTRTVRNFLLRDIVGVKQKSNKRKAIPAGYELAYTKLGQAYLRKIADAEDPEADKDAADEHARKGTKISLCSSQGELGRVFGEGIFQYFDFVKFLFVTNTVLFAFGLVSLVAHFLIDGWNPYVAFYENFFLSTYSPSLFHYWFWSCIVAALVYLFAFGPWLSARIRRRFSEVGYDDDEDRYIAVSSDDNLDVIKDETGRAKYPRRLSAIRLFFSYIGFLIILGISNAILLLLVIYQAYFNGGRGLLSLGFSLGISVAISVMNVIWKQICVYLTQFEQHYTYSQFLNHHTVKFFVWRILNVCFMFLGRWLVAVGAIESTPAFSFLKDRWADVGNPFADPCRIITVLAEQYTILLLIELTVGNLVEIVIPLIWLKFQQVCCNKVTGENLDAGRMDFDVAEEYLELLYRQFIVYMGMSIFPTIGFVGMIVNIVEYPLDKWRLLRLSRTPPPLRGSMHSFLVFFLFLSAVIAIIVFPYGFGWNLAGYAFTASAGLNCNSIYRGAFFSIPPSALVSFNSTLTNSTIPVAPPM